MSHHVMFLLLASFLLLLLCALCWPYPSSVQSRTVAKMRTTVQRLLKPRTPDDCLACRLATIASSGGGPVPADVASLARGEKPAGSRHSPRHPGLRLSQPKLPLLWHHRCTHTCGFSAMASMAVSSASKHFVVRPAVPRSLPGATPPCTG